MPIARGNLPRPGRRCALRRPVNLPIPRCFTIRPVTSQPAGRRGPPVTAGGLTHAGEHRQQPAQISKPKKAEHQPLRGGQQQITPRPPGLLPGRHHHRQAAAVNKSQSLQVHNHPRTRRHSSRQRVRQPPGIGPIKLAAQRNHYTTRESAGTHIKTSHRPASCPSSQAGSRPDSQTCKLPHSRLRRPAPAVTPARSPALPSRLRRLLPLPADADPRGVGGGSRVCVANCAAMPRS
jgi:hypothetical protein